MNNQIRKSNETQAQCRARLHNQDAARDQALRGNMVHVSKPLLVVDQQLIVTAQPGVTYKSKGIKAVMRRDRKDRVVSARQQRKEIKAWRAERKAELVREHSHEMPFAEDASAAVQESYDAARECASGHIY